MEIIKKAFLEKVLLILITLLLIIGCVPQASTPTKQATYTAIPSSCSWPPIQISGMAISFFRWLGNDNAIIYQQEGNTSKWFIYELSTGKIKETKSYPDPTKTPKNTLNDWEIESYDDLFISPDQSFAIYTLSNEQTLDVYLKTRKEKQPTFLGNIKGLIDQHIWIQNGKQIILSINWQSRWGAREAYVYLVDVVDSKIKVLIPNSVKNGNITVLGITPKEDKLLFTSYSGKDRSLRLFDIQNGSTTFTNIHTPHTLRWLPNKNQFWAIGYKPGGSLDFESYIYDIDNDSVQYVVPVPINASPFAASAIEISPDLKSIIFIEQDTQNLYKIDCSHVVP